MMLVTGISTRMIRKYRMNASCPIIMNGCSTGCPLIHVSVMRSATSTQNRHWLSGRNIMLRCLDVCSMGMSTRIRIENTRASMPPSLSGIGHRIV